MAQIRLKKKPEPDAVFNGVLVCKESTEKRWCRSCRQPWEGEGDDCGHCGSTEQGGSLRWAELALYRMTDGTGRYVVYVVGRSVVYHVLDNACGPRGRRSGKPVAGDKVNEDREPCARCLPPDLDELTALDTVDQEVDWHTLDVCVSPMEVLRVLRNQDTPWKPYSAPAERLIEAAKAADPAFAAALSAPQPL